MTSLTSLTSKPMSESREYKMKTRKCLYCGGAIPPDKRADSKFCHNSCKAHHWEENKGKNKSTELKSVPDKEQVKPQVEKPLDGLRGVIENKTTNDVSNVNDVKQTTAPMIKTPVVAKQVTKETQSYKDALTKKEKAESDLKRVENLLTTCESKIADWEIEKSKLKGKIKPKRYANRSMEMMDLDDTFWDETSESLTRDARESEINENIFSLAGNKIKLEEMRTTAKKIYDEAQKKLNGIQQFETVQHKPSLYELGMQMDFFKKKAQEKQIIPEETQIKMEQTESSQTDPEESDTITDSRILSAQQLKEMEIETLNFKGRWREFFGLPASIFHLAVHGNPGEGKSTFCLQFANYLAENHGKVIYISGEEGFSPTITKKLNEINVHKNLFITNYKKMEEIKEHIRNIYHFIFIDSLDNMGIDPEGLRELREHFPHSSFITISQSTKNGNMRGSQEIAHDCDIVAKVEKGIAMTTKNRFHKTGFMFDVFPTDQKNNVPNNKIEKPKMETLRNII